LRSDFVSHWMFWLTTAWMQETE